VLIRIKKAISAGLLALTPALTGCLVHTHSVLRTRPPDIVLSTSLDHLLDQVNQRYETVASMTSTVQLTACQGGSQEGEVKCYPTFRGFIIIGKPESIDFILLVPVFGGDALHMVSDGKTFKMLIPHDDCAITGADVVSNNSQKGLYSLRPGMILDSLLIHGLQGDQVVAMTQDSRTVPDPKTRKDVIEEPDYNLEFLSPPEGKVARSLRVIHIGRATLLPYRQDIYNADGKVATQADYSNYRKFGDVMFPGKIVIQRPLDELSLTITITKATFNQKLPDDQFNLVIPPTTAHVTNMDDPASGSIKDPCAVSAPPSTH
jgi:outer membrane lipoprotein-sorting protein